MGKRWKSGTQHRLHQRLLNYGKESPIDPANEPLLFLTRYGKKWVRTNDKGNPADAVANEFHKLLTRLNLKRPGLNFYSLRHTFRTIADNCNDQPAIDHVMGHVRNDMASIYREGIEDRRLMAVTETVRKWLFGEEEQKTDEE